MVVVAIILLLLSLLLPAIAGIRDRVKIDKAQAQMQMIAMAIDEYARFWPRVLTDAGGDGQPDLGTTHSSRGLPPWDFVLLWPGASGMEDNYQLSNTDPGNSQDPIHVLPADLKRQVDLGAEADIYEANESLSWCLTAQVGTGPYLKSPPTGLVVYVPLNTGDPSTYYPGSSPEAQRVRLYDPWGTPYFYCWVRNDGSWILTSPGSGTPPDGHVLMADAHLEKNKGFNFVLVSAGPDKEFEFVVNPAVAGADKFLGTTDDLPYGDDVVYGRGG